MFIDLPNDLTQKVVHDCSVKFHHNVTDGKRRVWRKLHITAAPGKHKIIAVFINRHVSDKAAIG